MKTLHTTQLGDGAYAGLDQGGHQIWLGANDHERMTVALDDRAIANLIIWLCQKVPHFAASVGETGLISCGNVRYHS